MLAVTVVHTTLQKTCCPYCGETIELVVDCSVAHQQYIEDCSVCCRPIVVQLHCSEAGEVERLCVATEND